MNRKRYIKAVVIVLLLALAAAVLLIIRGQDAETGGTAEDGISASESDQREGGQRTEPEAAQDEGETREAGLTFPYELENGRLSVQSIFQFTGFNPDNGEQEGENIAALTVVNQSDEYVVSAEIQVLQDHGAELTFEITDLPSGESVMVFEKENKTYEPDDVCMEITDTAEFRNGDLLMTDRIAVSAEGTAVTLTNHSQEAFRNLLLHCHCRIDGVYFGGLTYTYPVTELAAGQSVTVDAADCYLGEAAVVRISPDNGEGSIQE